MDFFKHQREAKEESTRMLVLFILGVVLVIIATIILLLPLFHYVINIHLFEISPLTKQVNHFALTERGHKFLYSIVLFVVATVGGGTLIKFLELSKGGRAVAEMLGAKKLSESEISPLKKQEVLNVTHEMAIASGIKPPEIYVLSDLSINTFAAGMEIQDSIICLTSGAIKELSRDELSAVVAHEIAHILSSDVQTNMYLTSILHGLMMISVMGKKLTSSKYDSNLDIFRPIRRNGLTLILAFFLIIAGYIGSKVAEFIRSFYSHEREFFADACAIQFTRSRDGLLGAFQKVWYRRFINRINNPSAIEVAHFLFTSTLKRQRGIPSTHPSLKERARRIDSSFRFNSHPPENYDSQKVRTPTPKQPPQSLQHQPSDLLDILLKRSSFSSDLNFSLFDFATLAISEHDYHNSKKQIQNALENCTHMPLKLRLWLTLESLDEQSGEKRKHLRLPKRSHPLTYFELEFVIVFSALIAGTNQDHSGRVLKLFKEKFPWCQDLINPHAITAEAFSNSFNKLAALNIDSKKVVHDFIREIINIDGKVSYEEEEFFKLLCTKLNMTLPGSSHLTVISP